MRAGGARTVDGHGHRGPGFRDRPGRGGDGRGRHGRTDGPAARGPGDEGSGMTAIHESERKGTSSGLFWPWCAANISVLAVPYGAFILSYGVSFGQAVVAGVIGIIGGFLLVGLVSIAGKRGSAPTLVLSRAPFGRYGNSLPGVVSYL